MKKKYILLLVAIYFFKNNIFSEEVPFGKIDYCKADPLEKNDAETRLAWTRYHLFITKVQKESLESYTLYPYFTYKDSKNELVKLPKELDRKFDSTFKDLDNIEIKGYCSFAEDKNELKPLGTVNKENDINQRCEFDKLSDEQSMQGRINWAYKWNHISYDIKNMLERNNLYPVFVDKEGNFQKAPTSSDAPYISDLGFVGPCKKSTNSEEVTKENPLVTEENKTTSNSAS